MLVHRTIADTGRMECCKWRLNENFLFAAFKDHRQISSEWISCSGGAGRADQPLTGGESPGFDEPTNGLEPAGMKQWGSMILYKSSEAAEKQP